MLERDEWVDALKEVENERERLRFNDKTILKNLFWQECAALHGNRPTLKFKITVFKREKEANEKCSFTLKNTFVNSKCSLLMCLCYMCLLKCLCLTALQSILKYCYTSQFRSSVVLAASCLSNR